MSRIEKVLLFSAILLILLVTWSVQFSQVNIVGADGYLHARMAEMISHQGLLKSLPQAHFSWFLTRFSDKDFVYHLYLIPFIKIGGLFTGTKFAAYLSTITLFLLVGFILYRNNSAKIVIPMTVILICSSQFLRDTAEARPFIWAMILTLIGIHYVLKRCRKAIFIISLIYGMVHLSAWILPVYTIIYSIYLWITGEDKKDQKINIILPAVSGYIVSFFLHPNFPNNIFYTFINGILVPWYATRGGVLELGAEFFPINTQDILFRYPFIFPIFGSVIFINLVYPYKVRNVTRGWGIAVLLLSIFAIISLRNITHLYPILIIFTGLYFTDAIAMLKNLSPVFNDRIKSIAIPMFIISLIFGVYKTVGTIKMYLYSDSVYAYHFSQMANVFTKYIPPGSRIFHSNWSDSQYFIGMAPQYEYYVTFDPVYMYSYNQNLYTLYRQLSFGQTQDPYVVLKDNFQTEYGYVGKNYFSALINQIRLDQRFTILAEDELGLVFSMPQKPTEKTQLNSR
jgi:hypothetical protein